MATMKSMFLDALEATEKEANEASHKIMNIALKWDVWDSNKSEYSAEKDKLTMQRIQANLVASLVVRIYEVKEATRKKIEELDNPLEKLNLQYVSDTTTYFINKAASDAMELAEEDPLHTYTRPEIFTNYMGDGKERFFSAWNDDCTQLKGF